MREEGFGHRGPGTPYVGNNFRAKMSELNRRRRDGSGAHPSCQSARCKSNLAGRAGAAGPPSRERRCPIPPRRRARTPSRVGFVNPRTRRFLGSRSDLSGGLPLGWELDGMLREATAGRRCGPASTLASVGAGRRAAPA